MKDNYYQEFPHIKPMGFKTSVLFLGIPALIMFIASVIAFIKEGNEMNWSTLKKRFRLRRIGWKKFLPTLASYDLSG